jgi:LysM repeat protein
MPPPPAAIAPPPAPELLAEAANTVEAEPTAETEDVGASIAALIEEEAAEPAPAPLAAEPAPPIRTASSTSERRTRRTVHTVQRGEYLLMIARQYGVTIGQLREWNGLEGSTVHPGQKLSLVPTRTARPAPARSTVHTVQSGDNLTRIAQRYGVTVQQLMSWNNLSSETIRPGQRLSIQRRTARG